MFSEDLFQANSRSAHKRIRPRQPRRAPLTVSPARQRQAEAAKAAEAILNDPARSLAYLTTPTEGATRLKQMQMEIDNPIYRQMMSRSSWVKDLLQLGTPERVWNMLLADFDPNDPQSQQAVAWWGKSANSAPKVLINRNLSAIDRLIGVEQVHHFLLQNDIPSLDADDTQRKMPDINEIEFQAIVLAVFQEAGGLDLAQQQVIVNAILNRMLLPVGRYTGHWDIIRQLDSEQLAKGILSGVQGETRRERIENAYDYYSDAKGFNNTEGIVKDFLDQPPVIDNTRGAISWIHIKSEDDPLDNIELASAIANRIKNLGQRCIEKIIRQAGVDPIINGSKMEVDSIGVTVYINMNYNIPSTENIECPPDQT